MNNLYAIFFIILHGLAAVPVWRYLDDKGLSEFWASTAVVIFFIGSAYIRSSYTTTYSPEAEAVKILNEILDHHESRNMSERNKVISNYSAYEERFWELDYGDEDGYNSY